MVCRSQTHRRSSMPEPPIRTHNAPRAAFVPASARPRQCPQGSNGTRTRGSRATLETSSRLLGNMNTFVRRFVAGRRPMAIEPTIRGTAVNFHTARGASRRSRAPAVGETHLGDRRVDRRPDRPTGPVGGRAHAKEIGAATILATLGSLVLAGWLTASGTPPRAAVATPAGADQPYEFAATSVSTGSITGVTALILICLITAAAVIGLLFYSPTPPRAGRGRDHRRARARTAMRPRRSGAALSRAERHLRVRTGHGETYCSPIRPRRPARSSRPSSGIRRCSSTSSNGR